MGVFEEEGVVDENGECWEVKGLYICDVSVFLIVLGVNFVIIIELIVYCIFKRIVEFLKEEKNYLVVIKI